MSNRGSFTPQVQDSDGQSDSKHFNEESRDYLPSNSTKTSQKMIVNLLMRVLIDLSIIKFTCQHHVSGYIRRV